jgi:hypothetical protein
MQKFGVGVQRQARKLEIQWNDLTILILGECLCPGFVEGGGRKRKLQRG